LHHLDYRGPDLLFKAVLAVRATARKPAYFDRAIDLGCGTGLAAAAFARQVGEFIGIDLSPGMIERARATGLYAELEVADMLEGLRDRGDASADLVLAGDAMVYVSDVVPVLAEVGRVLAAGGLVAFTVETHASDGVIIGNVTVRKTRMGEEPRSRAASSMRASIFSSLVRTTSTMKGTTRRMCAAIVVAMPSRMPTETNVVKSATPNTTPGTAIGP